MMCRINFRSHKSDLTLSAAASISWSLNRILLHNSKFSTGSMHTLLANVARASNLHRTYNYTKKNCKFQLTTACTTQMASTARILWQTVLRRVILHTLCAAPISEEKNPIYLLQLPLQSRWTSTRHFYSIQNFPPVQCRISSLRTYTVSTTTQKEIQISINDRPHNKNEFHCENSLTKHLGRQLRGCRILKCTSNLPLHNQEGAKFFFHKHIKSSASAPYPKFRSEPDRQLRSGTCFRWFQRRMHRVPSSDP